MAAKKKTSTRRKTKAKVGSTSKKTTAGKAKKACAAVGATVTLAGQRFKVKQYSKTKTAAKKVADSHRAKGKGKLARVTKTTCGWRVVTKG